MTDPSNTAESAAGQTIAVVGFGDLGCRLAEQLPRSQWQVLGLRRNVSAVPAHVEGLAVDLRSPATLTVLGERRPDALVVALSPTERSAAGYRQGFTEAMQAIVDGLGTHQPRHAFFVSSTRVYVESEGGWVDEDSELAIDDPHAAAIISAERCFLDGVNRGVVLRAAGLYGSSPGPMIRRAVEGRLSPPAPPRYGNRIHRDDVAGFMVYMLDRPVDQRVINLADDAPVALQEVESWLCQQLGKPYQPPVDTAEPDALSRVAGHKRIANRRLHATGYRLAFPDYRAGYGPIVNAMRDG